MLFFSFRALSVVFQNGKDADLSISPVWQQLQPFQVSAVAQSILLMSWTHKKTKKNSHEELRLE